MTDKEKIHQILSSLWKNDNSVGKAYYNQALQDVQTAIDLQEELVSDELEEAADNALSNVWNTHKIVNVKSCLEMFRYGVQWKSEQMMAKAIDGYVIEDIEEGNGDFLLSAEYLPKSMGLKDRQKVKVIVIKED